jgi:hypothetical protein
VAGAALALVQAVTAGQAIAFQTRCPGGTVYPGDLSGPTEIAGWMGRSLRGTGLPPELPVMAALVESGLRNARGGNADSVGFFQMRTGIWDVGEYHGFADDPQLQLTWFIDHALAVRHGPKAGPGAFRANPDSYGAWIDAIERPGEPAGTYTADDYQRPLTAARQLLQSGCDR